MNAIPLLITLLLLFLIFLLLRELICWYYKINVIVKQNDEHTKLLSEIRDLLESNIKETVANNKSKQ